MKFDTSRCDNMLPTVDQITLTIRFWNTTTYEAFLEIVERYTGMPLEPNISESGKHGKYSPLYGMYFEPPTHESHWWGRVYFQPTQVKLKLLQLWIEELFQGDVDDIEKRVHLKHVELSYDISIPLLSQDIYENIGKRISYYLFPQKSRNKFVTWTVGRDVNFSTKRDGAINGTWSSYIQSCKPKKRFLSSNCLKYNPRSKDKIIIYTKNIDGNWFIRIETTLTNVIKINHSNFSDLFEILKQFPLHNVFEFRTADINSFMCKIMRLPKSKKLKTDKWRKIIEEVMFQPVSDKIRIMRAMADTIGPSAKKLKEAIIKDFTNKISLQEAINHKLPSDCRVSMRTPGGDILEPTDFREPFKMLVHIGKPRYVYPVGELAATPMRRTKWPKKRRIRHETA